MKELLQEMIFITIALYAIGKSDVSVKVVFLCKLPKLAY